MFAARHTRLACPDGGVAVAHLVSHCPPILGHLRSVEEYIGNSATLRKCAINGNVADRADRAELGLYFGGVQVRPFAAKRAHLLLMERQSAFQTAEIVAKNGGLTQHAI